MGKREEDFRKRAEQFADETSVRLEEKYQTRHDYLAGEEYGCQYAIEKVYRFLEKYAANFVALPDEGQQPIGDTNAIYGTKSLLYYLRKEMEE